jgi:hypothetical protein
MPAELYAVAGSKIYIGGALASKTTDFVASDYSGQTWLEIDGWETMGALGDNAELITTPLINRGRDTKQKGTFNAGSYEAQFAIIPGDAGQNALRSAGKTKNNYAFRVNYPTGETEYFIALVMGSPRTGGGANDTLMLSATLEVNSNIVTV